MDHPLTVEVTNLPQIASRHEISATCLDGNQEITYQWSLTKHPGDVNLVIVQPGRSVIDLSEYITTWGLFKITFTITVGGDSEHSVMWVEVPRPDLEVNIHGGQLRQHVTSRSLFIESSAHDPANASAEVNFSWSCYLMNSLEQSLLYANNLASRSGLTKLPACDVDVKDFELQMDDECCTPGDFLLLHVTATDERQAESFQVVEMLDVAPPELNIRFALFLFPVKNFILGLLF